MNDREKHELSLLRQFFYCWTRAESSRGCYSCCEPHDCRCPAYNKRGECKCWRAELNKLDVEISESLSESQNELDSGTVIFP